MWIDGRMANSIRKRGASDAMPRVAPEMTPDGRNGKTYGTKSKLQSRAIGSARGELRLGIIMPECTRNLMVLQVLVAVCCATKHGIHIMHVAMYGAHTDTFGDGRCWS